MIDIVEDIFVMDALMDETLSYNVEIDVFITEILVDMLLIVVLASSNPIFVNTIDKFILLNSSTVIFPPPVFNVPSV